MQHNNVIHTNWVTCREKIHVDKYENFHGSLKTSLNEEYPAPDDSPPSNMRI